MSSVGAEMIAMERLRQIGIEGWTQRHDDEHDQHELALAAVAYAAPAPVFVGTATKFEIRLSEAWPWHSDDDKRSPDVRAWYPEPLATALTNRPELREQRIGELVKAGALLAAEIDRIIRLGGQGSE